MRLIAMGVFAANLAAGAADVPQEMDGMPLVFSEDFSGGAERWEMTDPRAWKAMKDGDTPVLTLRRASKYDPPVRSPESIAWVKDLSVGDFVLDVRCKQTGREYGHRDLCLFFGKQDAAHFYYVHLATVADDHANSIFLVDGKPRVSIAKERTDGTDWGSDVYQQIRVKRCVDSGAIEVYFNDMEKPAMVAEDKTFLTGTIGIGSFDDTGYFDTVHLWGRVAKEDSESGTAASRAE